MNIRKLIIEEINNFDWAGDVPSSDERGFYVGDTFIDTDDTEPISYRVKNIVGDKVLLTWFSPFDNKVVDYVDNLGRLESRLEDGFIKFKNTTNESIGEDFDWVREIPSERNYTIDELYGKKIYFRNNNLRIIRQTKTLSQIKREDISFRNIRWSNYFTLEGVDSHNNALLRLSDGGDVQYSVSDVEKYVNLGVWVVVDSNGRILNEFGDENKNLGETYYHLDRLVKRLMIITEDGKVKPDMEWDLTPQVKKEIDLSKTWVKTKEDVMKYLNILSDKLKKIPTSTRNKILKYVLASFIGIAGVSGLMDKVDDDIKTPTDTEIIRSNIRKPPIRKPSYKLKQFIKDEENLKLTAYNIGDEMITIGYGHAEPIGKTKMVAGKTKITKEKAEKLLNQDIQEATDGLNRILDSWVDQGIDVEITQGMYDAMTSMIFNMGIGNFRMSDFIQMVKRGEYEQAQDTIKRTNVTYPGHIPRREKESEIFGGSYNA